MPELTRIALSPVKAFALAEVDEVELSESGVVGNRRFLLVDETGTRLSSARTPWPVAVAAQWDPDAERLTMRFPGAEVEGSALANGERLVCDYHGEAVAVRVVEGPWEEALSTLAGRPVRLVRSELPNVVQEEPLTLCSDESLASLEAAAGSPLGWRRFRLLFGVAGCEPFEEDTWAGRVFELGDAAIRVGGPVERCAVVTRDPATRERDVDTLRLLRELRGSIHFGVYARVERPGRVRIGDELRPG